MSPEEIRKAAYRWVADAIDRQSVEEQVCDAGDPTLAEILRIRDTMRAAGEVPPLDTSPQEPEPTEEPE